MKITKRVLSIVMAIVTLVSLMGIAVEAASVTSGKLNLGYMAPTNAKGTKTVQSVTLYGDNDYINFYINSKKDNSYFAYEIYADKNYTKLKDANVVSCDKGTYSFTEKIKLKGSYSTRTYYLVTYGAKIYSDGSAKIDENSFSEFKITVKRSTDFKNKVVLLKEAKNTTKGAHITWSKLSGANKYYIYRRSLTGTKWTKVGTVSSSKTSFTDTSVKNKNGKYVYTVKAINKKGTASRYLYSGLICLFARTPVMESVEIKYNNAIEITWGKTSSSAKYDIYRKEGSEGWKKIKSNYSGTTYKDTTAENNKKYAYTVRAVIPTSYGTAISSYYANSDKAVTYFKAPKLNDVVAAETGVLVSWQAVEGVTGYKIFRRPYNKSESWTEIGSVGAEALEFTDTTADLDYSYIYTVRSEGSAGRGSYHSAGVNYHKIAKPEIIATGIYESNGYHSISWNKIKYATEYYLYKKNAENVWELVGTFDATDSQTQYGRVEPEKYVPTEYCVQAGYKSLRSEMSESAVLDAYPYTKAYTENRVDSNYIRITVNQKTDKYNVYKGSEGTDSSEYELVATLDVTGEEFIEYEDYDFTNETRYVIKGVFEGVEQSNFKSISIERTEEPAQSRSESVACESTSQKYFKITITHPDYDGYYADYYFYDYAASKWVEVTSHYTNKNKHFIYENNFPGNFTCSPDGEYKLSIVYTNKNDYKGTPIDSNVLTFYRSYAPIEGFTATAVKKGAKISWDAVDGVSKYIVDYSVDDVTKTVEIVADGSSEYSAVLEADINTTKHINYFTTITCVYTENSTSANAMPEIEMCGTPKISKTKYYSKTGIVELYYGDHEGTGCEFTVYRKEKGDSSWTAVRKHADSDAYDIKYGDALWDKTAKPGKTYVYTLRASSRFESSEDLILLRSYYDEEGTVCKT